MADPEQALRVLFFCDPDSANTKAWIDGMRTRGCVVQVASARGCEDAEEPVIEIGPSWLTARSRILFGKKDAINAIKTFKPDILLAYRVTSYGYLAALTGFHPVVLAAQNEQITYMRYPSFVLKWLLSRFARKAIKHADLIHAWGSNIRDGLIRFGATPEQVMVMHRGINMSLFSDDAPRKIDTDKPVFVSTRSLAREYRIDQLIRAFKIVTRDIPGARLLIIGDGSEKAKLMDFVRDLGLNDSVEFLGRLPWTRVAERLRHSDIYVSLIETEGVSSSLIEACAMGLTPIVYDMPSSRDLITHGENGFLLTDVSSPVRVAETMVACARAARVRSDAERINKTLAREKFDNRQNLAAFIARYRALIRAVKERGEVL